MNCQEFREQLDAALDEQRVVSTQTGAVGISAHVESCAECRVLYEEHLLIGAAVAAWKPRRPVVDLTDRVIEATREAGLISSNSSVDTVEVAVAEPIAGKPRTDDSPFAFASTPARSGLFDTPGRLRVLSVAASLVLVFGALTVVFYKQAIQFAGDEKKTEQLLPDQQPRQLDKSQDQLADIGHLVADAQSAWRGITSRVSHQASGFSVFVPDLKDDLGIPGVTDSLEISPEPPGSKDDSGSRQSAEPSAVEKAFEFLFDDGAGDTQTI